MSGRRDIEIRLGNLNEIKEIMNAMKNLSLMEVHKLTRFLESQRKVMDSIEAAATDFLQFYRGHFPRAGNFRDVFLLVGSERGFCGDFNESLMQTFENHGVIVPEKSAIAVGAKLAAKLGSDVRLRAAIDGAGVAEEVDAVLVKLMEALTVPAVPDALSGPLRLTVFHHRPEREQVIITVLQPLQFPSAKEVPYTHAPLLYLAPQTFLVGLVEQFLVARLHEVIYSSLMAENQRRMQHMDAAVRQLEKKSGGLMRRRNALRQEEITEEIEVIMLSVKALEWQTS